MIKFKNFIGIFKHKKSNHNNFLLEVTKDGQLKTNIDLETIELLTVNELRFIETFIDSQLFIIRRWMEERNK